MARLVRRMALAVAVGACSGDGGGSGGGDPVGPKPCVLINPIAQGQDPWVVRHGNSYYLVESTGRSILVYRSQKLSEIKNGTPINVWRAPQTGWNRDNVWAPELHFLNGKWYIYYAADAGENKDHRTGVLESVTADPQGEYVDRGMIYTGDDIQGKTNNRWAIDATPLEMNGRLYLIWSGWEGEADEQWLYIAEMQNPYTVKSNRVRIADNDDYLWERVDESLRGRGLNEGPQILRRDGWVHVIYSASGSWQPSYKLGRLTIREGADPMVPANWKKHPEPVFQGNARVLGVGHASYTKSPDGREDWIVYHSKIDPQPGWRRSVRIQPFRWNADGTPNFGEAIPEGVPLPLPSGEEPTRPGAAFSDSFPESWDPWVFYGYNRYISVQDGALSLNAFPGPGMANNYSSGEKALIRGLHWADLQLSARVTVARGEQAGLLFRATHPAVGVNAVRGYFAGLVPGAGRVVLGKMDGARFTQIATADLPVRHGSAYQLAVRAVGPDIEVLVDGQSRIRAQDAEFGWGMAGVRGVDAHALFDDVQVAPVTGR